jgi:3-oxoacyl-[acyl-carrier protein] reductase
MIGSSAEEITMANRPVALITGAGRGIGRGIALELVRAGYDVAGCDIVYEPGNTAVGLFEVAGTVAALGRGAEFLPLRADIAAIDSHDALLQEVLGRFGRLDLLVNNAGVAPETRTDVLETTPESFDRVLAINLRGPFFLSQKAARIMAAGDGKGGAAIVFITSISAETSSLSRAEYCLSKAGLSMAARIFADRLAGSGVNVYEIRPGIVLTDMTAPVREKYDRLIAEGLVPQGRWGTPEDVGKAVAALARGAFAYSTGLVLEVSGGMNIRRL